MMTIKYKENKISEEETKKTIQISNQTTKNVLNDMSNFKFNTTLLKFAIFACN